MMMGETYVECLIKRKTPASMQFLKLLALLLGVGCILLGLMIRLELLAVSVVFFVASYYISINSDLEYEYLYLDKEVTVDKVIAKTKRKRVAQYDLETMEIFAPLQSHYLDSYRNRQTTTVDYSSGVEQQPEKRYAMYCEGGKRVILEPSPEMVKAMKGVAPRKVFME
ncbi:MAG: hypothetical protein IKM28_05540 [Lachnospiraceae bacterium]|nr:hypothetical protein [Lachnospiraceae bacterium]